MATITTTMDAALPRHIDVDVFEQAVANTNFDTVTINTSALVNGWKESSGAQNDLIDFNVVLIKGTWDIEVMHVNNTNNGIISVQLDAVEKGTIDTYAAGVSYNNRTTVSGVAVASTGKVTLRLKMATKHASSSSYVGEVQHIQLRCTSATDTSSITIDPDTQMPWLISVVPFMTPSAHTNFNTNTVDGTTIYNGFRSSSGAQNDQIDFSVTLAAGTWDIEIMYRRDTDNGVFSVQIDGAEVGTVDSYGAGSSQVLGTVSGVAVAATGNKTLRLKMATKNASSSSYIGEPKHIQLRRTA